MRKFRMWNGVEMIYPKDDDRDNILINGFGEVGFYLKGCMDWWTEDTESIALQYIGLKDKNKKDIYEDDLITDIHGNVKRVIFESGGFWTSSNGDLFMPAEKIREVVGNIHEHPNLLPI